MNNLTPERESASFRDSSHRDDRTGLVLEQARSVFRQLRELLTDVSMMREPALRLALADELLQEIEVLGLGLQRPTVRQAIARVRRSVGLPASEHTVVSMPVDTALAFLSLAIDPPAESFSGRPD